MLRLPQREQILILDAANKNPGPLADWLIGWVTAQQKVGAGGAIEIWEIPIPKSGYPPVQPVNLDAIAPPTPAPIAAGSTRQEILAKRKKMLDDMGYKDLPLAQRRAVRKYMSAEITAIEETDRMPDSETCWLGDHEMEGWDRDDFYLWVVAGKWSSDKSLRKWGCQECAEAISKVHPEARINYAID